MLALKAVTKNYGRLKAVDGITLEIRRGEFFGLLGPNGAGKSTLISLLARLHAPDGGSVSIAETPLDAGRRGALRRPGLVPQSIALYEEFTAEQNLRFFGELQGLYGAQLRRRVSDVLEAVQLASRKHDRVATFSGGMQRRLNLAAALLHQPELLLCDEPTAGVDPHARNAIFDILESLNREGTTIIYSTHYMEEAARLCSRIGIMDHGRLLAEGTLAELLTRLPFDEQISFPVTPATAALASRLGVLGRVLAEADQYHFLPASGFRLSAFFTLTESHGLPPRFFTLQRPTLEALFLHLTGRSLRE